MQVMTRIFITLMFNEIIFLNNDLPLATTFVPINLIGPRLIMQCGVGSLFVIGRLCVGRYLAKESLSFCETFAVESERCC